MVLLSCPAAPWVCFSSFLLTFTFTALTTDVAIHFYISIHPGRHLARKWILTLFVGTSLLYCARMAMPICVVSLAEQFHWSKVDSAMVLGGFFWGYCLTQIVGGHASDK